VVFSSECLAVQSQVRRDNGVKVSRHAIHRKPTGVENMVLAPIKYEVAPKREAIADRINMGRKGLFLLKPHSTLTAYIVGTNQSMLR
jgi:hypothetical protein